jgi:membrane-bound serine protease (ClpP class)
MIRHLFRITYLTILLILFLFSLLSHNVNASSIHIEVLKVEGTIVPVVADYINRGISNAETRGNTVCIIELNTPGGLLNTTESIVQRIMNAKVPIVVYVSPHGGWAASAGTFITISSHIAAMAPATTIGAAHPVNVGEQMSEVVSKKATEYSAAWIKSIAETRGRDPIQAELAVTESKSFTVSNAIENRLVDFQASDLENLIKQLNGRKVILSNNEMIVIDTTSYVLVNNDKNWVEQFLHTISDPNIAYILLSIGSLAIITEVTNPGMIFPGVIGGLSLLLAFYSLGTLNAYWAGVLLIMLAFCLFIAEIFTSAFGILTAGGIASLILGSLMLFTNNPMSLEVNHGLIAVVVIIVVAFFVFVVGAVIRGQRRKSSTGIEGLTGQVAVALTKLNPNGTVLIEGERWTAVVETGNIEPGEEVIVSAIDGLKLKVTKK